MTVHSMKLAVASATDRLRHAKRRPRATVSRLAGHAWLLGRAGRTVYSGPFAGTYLPLVWPHLPCLIGSYEKELSDCWMQIIQLGFKRFIDVGAADGYYAIGLARLVPHLVVDAFELNEAQHVRMARMAAANGVRDRLRIHGFCDPAALRASLREADPQTTLLLVDIEGGEGFLIDPIEVPQLAHTYMLVELHGGNGPRLIERFSASHEITKIDGRPRELADFPLKVTAHRSRWIQRLALDSMHERRQDGFAWLWMVPRR